jgi:hypothetical protein
MVLGLITSSRATAVAGLLAMGCVAACATESRPGTEESAPAGHGHAQGGAGAGAAGSGEAPPDAGTSAGHGGATAPLLTAGRVSSGATALPCDVADVLARRCQSCHARAPLAGVPMALVSWEDLHAPAVTRPELYVRELAAMRVHDADNPMPPNTPLPAAELATLDAWFDAGAERGDGACGVMPEPDGGATSAPPGPPADSTCYTLRAHGAPVAGDTSPWMVANQHYACFYFDAPWPDGAQGVYFDSAFDEHANMVHHWIVYLDENGNQPDGFVETCTGLHPTSPTMVAGWAPGSDNNDLPPDVGMHLSPPNRKVMLEMHFFHDGLSAPVPTTSGVRICTANTPRPNTATISLLGTEAIALAPHAEGTASGTCTPQSTTDIHILRSWPHMHELGRELETMILRADGSSEPLGRWAFDFNSQVSWPTPVTISPGDRLVTTCRYDNMTDRLVGTGTDTQSEMCFNFVTAYPAKALASHNAFGGSSSATGSATACLQ